MDSHFNKEQKKQAASISEKEIQKIDRRDFTKKALLGGMLSSLGLFVIPDTAEAWLDGKIQERDDLGDAFRVSRSMAFGSWEVTSGAISESANIRRIIPELMIPLGCKAYLALLRCTRTLGSMRW